MKAIFGGDTADGKTEEDQSNAEDQQDAELTLDGTQNFNLQLSFDDELVSTPPVRSPRPGPSPLVCNTTAETDVGSVDVVGELKKTTRLLCQQQRINKVHNKKMFKTIGQIHNVMLQIHEDNKNMILHQKQMLQCQQKKKRAP
ncbi:hypothetical protein XENTR_v10024273 [Xenopus tropicalis]|nr:hypothetical protein XENTR_v10024273 [Xenopus tropicalis]KAE8580015.1 hypothetical protein XENTR_v10024273 [Xenopus tropicalis]